MNKKKNDFLANESGTMLHKKLSFAATEAYKLLRTNLMFTLTDNEKKCKIVGVTSSIRGEGKSTTAANLSYALAETGKKVLLIDGDLRLPSLKKKLEIETASGLSNVIAGTVNAEDAIVKIDKLDTWYLLSSGDIPPNPTEMLGSPQMKKLLDKLSLTYDFIVIDLPPVNIVSDALVISPFIDGMLVVVRENYSERRVLNVCIGQLELSNVKILGFVMNVAGEDSTSYGKYKYKRNKYYKYYSKYYKRSHYGYSYGYGYGYGSSSKKHKEKKSEEK